ncbi:hypothetical protein NPX13_g7876 [Xylaria arbuscula]|uniref:Zn(2)-C6 fungal-type domain-containing protein n=1 Tax=Xylaria arbuscula TaxID=114810 RepID=A0A9W8TKQ7_9PEZI|nr:hypothetical protein NPX13_g7876 [Xylaria arbuscula]
MTTTDTSSKNDPDAKSNIRFCDLCNKPIVSETAFKRHLAYCRRTAGKPKKRKRSCRECHRAKAKCSFEPQCTRCISKRLVCEYEKNATPLASSQPSKELQDSPTPDPAESTSPSDATPSDATTSPDSASSYIAPNYDRLTQIAHLQRRNTPPRHVSELRTDPKHQANAQFLIETLRSVPYMMSRRETFPCFLYGQWHKPELPVTFTNCMRICELYIARNSNPYGREVFYSAVREEGRRFMQELPTARKEEIATSLAIQIMYLLLGALEDHTPQPQASFTPELFVREGDIDLVTFFARSCFESDRYQPFDTDLLDNPDQTWEEFIYAESRRRCALFWFTMSRVIDLSHGQRSPPVLGCRGLTLPAPAVLWNARTREEWEAARAEIREHRREPLYNTSLRTVGDLIERPRTRVGPRLRPESQQLARGL